MADKKITDLQQISALTDSDSVPTDDGSQTYRFTMPQLVTYLLSKLQAIRTFTANTTILQSDSVLLLDGSSGAFTQALPAVASLNAGTTFKCKNISTGGQTVTLDANGSELIDNALTVVLGSTPNLDSVTIYNTGTKWLIL